MAKNESTEGIREALHKSCGSHLSAGPIAVPLYRKVETAVANATRDVNQVTKMIKEDGREQTGVRLFKLLGLYIQEHGQMGVDLLEDLGVRCIDPEVIRAEKMAAAKAQQAEKKVVAKGEQVEGGQEGEN